MIHDAAAAPDRAETERELAFFRKHRHMKEEQHGGVVEATLVAALIKSGRWPAQPTHRDNITAAMAIALNSTNRCRHLPAPGGISRPI